MDFAILKGPSTGAADLMLQTRASVREDLPTVAKRDPSFVLYADVDSLTEARRALAGARILVEERTPFYGATESWLELPGGALLGLAQHG